MTIEWSDSLLTGVQAVDDQHKELFRRLADLNQAIESGKDDAMIAKTVQFLEDYVKEHFRDEEALMLQYNYPGYPAQKHSHDTFNQKMAEIKTLLETEGITPSLKAKLKINVESWLINHIDMLDRKLGLFMQQQTKTSV